MASLLSFWGGGLVTVCERWIDESSVLTSRVMGVWGDGHEEEIFILTSSMGWSILQTRLWMTATGACCGCLLELTFEMVEACAKRFWRKEARWSD